MALLRNSALLPVGLLLLAHTWGVWCSVEVDMEDRVEVYKGDDAQINCMFTSSEGVGGLVIQWFYVTDVGVRNRIYYQDATVTITDRGTPFTGRMAVKSSLATGQLVLTVSQVGVQDELEFICQVNTLTDGSAEGRTVLKVFVAPELPTIEGFPNGISVSEENPSKIGSCEAQNGFPRPNITWYRDDTPLQNVPGELNMLSMVTHQSSGLYSVKSELAMKVVKEDKDARFYCEVTYFVPGGTRMTESVRINITVYYPTTEITVRVESPKGRVKEGDTVWIQCRADGFPQPPFTFKYQGTELEAPAAPPHDVLVLKDVTRLNNGVYQCVSLDVDTFEDIMGETSLEVNFLDEAVVIPNSYEVSQGEELEVTCNALSSLKTVTTWFKNGREVSSGHVLKLKDAVFDMSGTYECVVSVAALQDMRSRGTVEVVVRGPPQIITPENTAIEEAVQSTVNLTCQARGYPVPTISWSASDAQVLKSVSRQTVDGVLSVASVKVTSDITAFCNASNTQGTAAVAFTIRAILHTTTTPTTTTTTTPTTTPTTTKSTTKSTTTTTTTTTTVKATTALPGKSLKKEGNGVVIAVIIILILLLAVLGSVLYFLYKKGKICGRSGKQDLTKQKSNKDIVVEMKGDTEEAVLLGVNGEKKPPSDQ